MRLFLVSVLAIALLSGCATPQQRAAEAQQAVKNVIEEMKLATDSDRALDPIRNKIPLNDPRDASLSMLALTAFPTEPEKQAIDAWQTLIRTQRPRAMAVIQHYYPWAVPIFNMGHSASLSLAADLYAGKLSYGDFNKKHLALENRLEQALQQREGEVRQQQMQAAQVAAQQSLAMSAALANYQTYLSNQQLINQRMQPTRIAPFTCTRFGNTTNCY